MEKEKIKKIMEKGRVRKSSIFFILFLVFYIRIYLFSDWGDVGTQISFLFFTPILFWIAYYLYKTRYDELWLNGLFPQRLKYNRDSMQEAYICLAALLIQKDPKNVREKSFFLVNHLKKNFPNTTYHFGESISFSYSNPIKPKTVATWLKLNIKEETKRMQILYFLVELSAIDGVVIAQEYRIIKEIAEILGLPAVKLEQVIQTFQAKHERITPKTNSSISKRKMACAILEVPEETSLEGIKKAYRKMVKIHHPDRFHNESKEEQDRAKERFLELQKAYEWLTQ